MTWFSRCSHLALLLALLELGKRSAQTGQIEALARLERRALVISEAQSQLVVVILDRQKVVDNHSLVLLLVVGEGRQLGFGASHRVVDRAIAKHLHHLQEAELVTRSGERIRCSLQ